MRRIQKDTRGFTFTESVISLSIVGVFLALMWAAIGFMAGKASQQAQRAQAHFLAIEGLERLRQMRQTALNRHVRGGFWESLGSKSGSYILGQNGQDYTLEPGQNEVIELEGDPYGFFCRTVILEGDAPDTRRATVELRWGESGECEKADQQLAYSAYFYSLNP